MKNRILSILLASMFFISANVTTSFAVDNSSETDTVQLVTSESDMINIDLNSYEELVTISEDDAEAIALLFVHDALSFEEIAWNSDTYITNVVVMYDDKCNITAYSVELDKGYVIVSAFADAESLIPEWSDRASPVYDSLDTDDTEQILYLGAYEYYLDVGNNTVEDIEGSIVDKNDLINDIDVSRDASNIPTALIEEYVIQNEFSTSVASVITDPFTHANRNYAGPFVSNDYVNLWENYALFFTTSNFNNVNGVTYHEHCGPTAITNLMCMYQYKYRGIKNSLDAAKTIFNYVAQYGISHAYYVNSTSVVQGTSDTGAAPYIRNVFANYLDVSVGTVLYEVTYNNFKSTFENGRLMYLMLRNHADYGNHHLVGYAYTRLISSTTGWYKTYIKVCDGWGTSGRYIDLASVSSNSSYYGVVF